MNSDRNNACATPPKPTSGALIITGSIYWKLKDIFKCSVGNGGHASFHCVRDRRARNKDCCAVLSEVNLQLGVKNTNTYSLRPKGHEINEICH